MDFYSDDDVQIGPRAAHGEDQSHVRGAAAKQPAAEGAAGGDAAAAAAKPRKKSKPRPKLTLDLLKEPHGLNDVFCKFPHALRAQFKGRNHEVGDLQRVLELYTRWQQRIFPHGGFDDFVQRLEKLGSTATAKNELRELRAGLVRVLAEAEGEGTEGEGEGAQGHAGGAPAPAPPPSAPRAAGGAAAPVEEWPDFPDPGEEDLEAAQEDQWDLALEAVPDLEDQMDAWGAAPAAPKLPAGPEERLPGGQQQGHEQQGQGQGQGSVQEQGQGQQEESVGPLGQAPGGGGCSSGAAAAGQQGDAAAGAAAGAEAMEEDGDEELLRMAGLDAHAPGPEAGTARAHPPPVEELPMDDDEELLRMAGLA